MRRTLRPGRRTKVDPAPTGPEAPAVRVVAVREGTIRLGQFLKLADLVDTGADAKPLIAEGHVQVNGEEERRRGRQLAVGDVVSLGGQEVRVGDADEQADDLPW